MSGALSESKVFCIRPWMSLRNRPDGAVFPCCTWNGGAIGSMNGASLEELLNAEPLKKLRRDMLAGAPSPSCEGCYAIERSGLESDRLRALRGFPSDVDLAATGPDGGLERPRLRHLGLFLSNVCNFKCRTCGPSLSTGWYEDIAAIAQERFGAAPRMEALVPAGDDDAFLRKLEPHLEGLEALNFQGGEPLLAPLHYRILERLIARGRANVQLSYNTNLSVLGTSAWDAPRLWDRFESVHVTASLDGIGTRGEYIRKGLVWGDFEANWARLQRECPRVRLSLGVTVSVFNVFHLPDLVEACLEKGFLRGPGAADDLELRALGSPECYGIQVLPPAFKAKAALKYRSILDRFPAGRLRDLLESIVRAMNARDESARLPELAVAVRQLDRIRGERFEDVFPELAGLI